MTFRNPDLLWTASQLKDRMGANDLRILDVRLGEEYAMGHIPGAIHFSTYALNTYDTDPAPLRSFTHMWAFLLSQRGIGPQHEVVVCGNNSGMNAARAFWFLEYLGYERVHLLDGGYTHWRDDGHTTTRDAVAPKSVACTYHTRTARVASYLDVLGSIDEPSAVILDTRSRAEWDGSDGRAERNGTIPSAVHQDWRAHLATDGRLKPAAELSALFDEIGCGHDKRVIPFCNTGYRSAHAYVVLRLLGHPDVRNYVGSWQEWGNRAECPVVIPE
jgi:thiosulfate/3-mercaptopyruvate sulfurtransferase